MRRLWFYLLTTSFQVIFIDYGTMTKVSTKGLCFLHAKFSTFEAQAVRCRLANVFPLEEGAPWSREACKGFRKLVVDKDLTAKIIHINWDVSRLPRLFVLLFSFSSLYLYFVSGAGLRSLSGRCNGAE